MHSVCLPPHPAVAYLFLVRRMATFFALIILSITIALLVVWLIVSRDVSKLRAFILAVIALLLVTAICGIVGYFGLRVHINDHYEINLVLLRLFVLPPIAAGIIAGLLSAAMFAALRRRERASSV